MRNVALRVPDGLVVRWSCVMVATGRQEPPGEGTGRSDRAGMGFLGRCGCHRG